jgi:hypothetical protein
MHGHGAQQRGIGREPTAGVVAHLVQEHAPDNLWKRSAVRSSTWQKGGGVGGDVCGFWMG